MRNPAGARDRRSRARSRPAPAPSATPRAVPPDRNRAVGAEDFAAQPQPPSPRTASPAIGVWQDPSSAARKARSAASLSPVSPWWIAASSAAACHRQRAVRFRWRPGATAGSISSGSMATLATWARSSRFSPAIARNVATAKPSSSFFRRVWTLPRNSTSRRSGRRWASCARRRKLEEPTVAPCGRIGQTANIQRDESIAYILARQVAVQDQARRLQRGHVLHRMDGDVDGAVGQRLFYLAGEKALAADVFQRPVQYPVASGLDDGDGKSGLGQTKGRHQARACFMRLRQRERRAAGANPERGGWGRASA